MSYALPMRTSLLLLTLLGSTPALAGTSQIVLASLPVESETGEGVGQCLPIEDIEAVYEREFTFSKQTWAELRDLVIVAEGRHRQCDVLLQDLIVEIDGREEFRTTLNAKGFGEGVPGWYVQRTVEVPDIEKSIFDAGDHTIVVRLTAQADSEFEQVRVSLAGLIEHGRDWDDDGFDDEALTAGDDCNDDDASINPGADETWYDGVDQDCAGDDDYDQDGDGAQAEGEIEGGDDCDDTEPRAFPGNEEVWYDGIDGNCNGDDDYDQDGDGYQAEDEIEGGEDCDDLDGSKYPGARTWDEDCNFIVRTDDSRVLPPEPEATGSGCTRGAAPAAAGLLLLPLLGLRRRR